MAFAKAEALTMVCMKNRFWTLIARCRNFMNFGIFFYKKFSVYFFGGEKKRKVDSLCPRRNRTIFSKLLMKIGFLLIWRFALSDVLLCPLVTWRSKGLSTGLLILDFLAVA